MSRLSRDVLDELVPPSPGIVPISAPRWVWGLHVLLVVVLAFFASVGGFFAFAMVLFAAQASFMFGTFTTHRGVRRRGAELSAPLASSAEGWDA